MLSMLRPQFTKDLLNDLNTQSYNICGRYGQGQQRLASELGDLARAAGWIVLSLDLKHWAEDYAGMVTDLARQLRSQLPNLSEPLADFGAVVGALDRHAASTTVLLILNRFDALLDNTVHLDSGFGDFFLHLNALRNQPQRTVLALTEKPYNRYRFYLDKIHNTSPLDLRVRELPALTYQEILDELSRRRPATSRDRLAALARAAHRHEQAYDFLEHCLDRINGSQSALPRPEQLRAWRKSFDRSRKTTLRRKLDKCLNGLHIVAKEIGALSTGLKALLIALVGLAAAAALFVGKIETLLGWAK